MLNIGVLFNEANLVFVHEAIDVGAFLDEFCP